MSWVQGENVETPSSTSLPGVNSWMQCEADPAEKEGETHHPSVSCQPAGAWLSLSSVYIVEHSGLSVVYDGLIQWSWLQCGKYNDKGQCCHGYSVYNGD